MSHNFITNNTGQRVLRDRLNTLISISEELKFLVGFFYFSGWKEVYQQLKANDNITLKLLVGLEVDKMLNKGIVEYGFLEDGLSDDDRFNKFMSSLQNALDNDDMDNKEFYNQVSFFLEMMSEGRLIIRKTKNPNHSKLYLFRLNDDQALIQGNLGQFITGSSNLTSAGLVGQEEFNVEIKDYGYNDADKYFDELWKDAVLITEDDEKKTKVLDYVGNKTLAAKVTPYEAYALVLKTYIELQQQKKITPILEELLEKKNYKKYKYQIDAVNQGLSIIEEYNGVIIADVVGLGKSVIASMIAKSLDKKTMIICPPGLIGEKNKKNPSGWYEYAYNFELNCEIESRGKLVDIAESIDNRNIEVVIVDEAHYFRNQDTDDYEALLKICRDRIVILLSATPFNNSPADIFSLLKLFIIPGKSGITIDNDLEALFVTYGRKFEKLSFISKYWNPKTNKKGIIDEKKIEKKYKSERIYKELFDELPLDIKKVKTETKKLANTIKQTISPVIIRRNRLDLKNDKIYSEEINDLSVVNNPQELFYKLTQEQSEFYDKVISEYFGDGGRFKGAIYQPYWYEKIFDEKTKIDEQGNRKIMQQTNLYDFMRRLLVKRFESSFGAFSKSIDSFLKVQYLVKSFIEKTDGRFILDRKLIYYLEDENNIEQLDKVLEDYENNNLNKKTPKNTIVYDTNKFERKDEFFNDIDSDIELLVEIQGELKKLDIVDNDPKRDSISKEINKLIKTNPQRKIIVFSEYVDTVKHLKPFFENKFPNQILFCEGDLSHTLDKQLNSNFNAQFKGEKEDKYKILITSDKLSEGLNLNRAGVIINYDIPWNPTRVIQRVGRINRIGTTVFDDLFIYNFFPTESGSTVVQIREIAMQKMFLIHNALGEDSKMFNVDEEPTPAGLFNKFNLNPDNEEEENISTKIRNTYLEIQEKHPEIIKKIENLPLRVKSGKTFSENQVCVLRKKGLSLFTHNIVFKDGEDLKINELTFEDYLTLIECEFDTPNTPLSDNFWIGYDTIRNYKPKIRSSSNIGKSLESKAKENLKVLIKLTNPNEEELVNFIKMLIDDIVNYKTLSDKTISRIGRNEISNHSSEKQVKLFREVILGIKQYLGKDYLNRILKRVEHQKNEVVIAIENTL